MLGILSIFGCLSLVASQSQCDCSVFSEDRAVFSFPFGPLYSLPLSDPGVECDDAGDVRCDRICLEAYQNWASNTNITDAFPGDSQNRNYGEVFCERIKAIIGPEPIAVTGSTEGWRRITNCTEWADWEQVTDQPYLEFCCNQLGNYVPNCPQL